MFNDGKKKHKHTTEQLGEEIQPIRDIPRGAVGATDGLAPAGFFTFL